MTTSENALPSGQPVAIRTLILAVIATAIAAARPAAAQELANLPTNRAVTYEFKDIRIASIERYLRFAGIRLPFTLQGQLSGWIWAQNRGSYFSLNDYVVETKITSPAIVLEGFDLRDVLLRLRYGQGVWTLKTLEAGLYNLPGGQAQSRIARLSTSGTIPAEADGVVSLRVSLEELLLSRLLASLGQTELELAGTATAELNATVVRDQLGDLTQWNGDGQVRILGLRHPAIRDATLEAPLRIDDGAVELVDAAVRTDRGASIGIAGRLSLVAGNQFAIELPRQPIDLQNVLSERSLDYANGIQWEGLELGASGEGTLAPLQWRFEINSGLDALAAGPLALRDLEINGPIDQNTIGPVAIAANGGGGTIQGSYRIADYATDEAESSVSVTATDVDLRTMLPPDTLGDAIVFGGQADVRWPGFSPQRPEELIGRIAGRVETPILAQPPGPIEFSVEHRAMEPFTLYLQAGEGGQSLSADGRLQWQQWQEGSYSAQLRFAGLQIDLAGLTVDAQLPAELGPTLTVSGTADVAAENFETFETATFELSEAVATYRGQPLGLRDIRGDLQMDRLQVETATAFVGENRATGGGVFRLDDQGEHTARLQIDRWPLAAVLEPALGTEAAKGLTGFITAAVDLRKDASEPASAGWDADASLFAEDLAYRDTALGRFTAAIEAVGQRVVAAIDGQLLGGEIAVAVDTTLGEESDTPLRLRGSIDQLAVSRMLEAGGADATGASGIVQLIFEAAAPAGSFTNPGAWNGQGELFGNDLKLPSARPATLYAPIRLADGQLGVVDAILRTDRGELAGLSAAVTLDRELPFTLSVPKQRLALENLLEEAIVPAAEDFAVAGLNAGLSGGGSLSPLRWRLELDAEAAALEAGAVSLREVSLQGPVTESDLGPLDVAASAGGGLLRGQYAVAGYREELPETITSLQSSGLDFRAFLPDGAVEFPLVFAGNADLRWTGLAAERPTDLVGRLEGEFANPFFTRPDAPLRVSVVHPEGEPYVIDMKSGDSRQYLTAAATLDWREWDEGSYAAAVEFAAIELDLLRVFAESDALGGLPPELGSTIAATGEAEVKATSFDAIDAASFNLAAAQIIYDGQPLGLRDVRGSLQPDRLQIDSATAFIASHTAAGSGVLRRDGQGFHTAELQLSGWPLNDVLGLVGGPVPIAAIGGEVSANLQLRKDASETASSGWAGDGTLQAVNLTYQTVPVGYVRAVFDANEDRVRLDADGELFGGELSARTRFVPDGDRTEYPLLGDIELRQADLPALMAIYQTPQEAERFAGATTARVEFGVTDDSGVRGNVTLDVENLRLDGESLTDRLELAGTFDDRTLQLRRFETPFGGGRLTGSLAIHFEDLVSFDGSINGQRVDLSKLIAVFNASLSPQLQGIVSGRLTLLSRGDSIAIRGGVTGDELEIYGVPVDDGVSNLNLGYRFGSGVLSLDLNSIQGQSLGGRLTGDFGLRYARYASFDGDFQIVNGDVEEFADWFETGQYFGSGIFNAQASIGADRYRSIGDLAGAVSMQFGPTDAQSVPLITPIASAIPAVGLPQTRFDQGSLDGTIGGGVFRITNSLLYNPRLWMSAAGNIGLENQTIDLEVTIFTGSTADSQILTSSLANLVSYADPTLATIRTVSELVSNRTFFLRVGGTASQPVIRLQTARTVSRYVAESLIRQFTQNLIIPGAAGAAVTSDR